MNMAKNKYDFIIDLLDYKKISVTQKERILKLSAQEIKLETEKDEELIKRIEEIELIIKSKPSRGTDNPTTKKTPSGLPEYDEPVNLYKFLLGYNQNKILRSTCHDIDSDAIEIINDYCGTEKYNFQLHLKKILEEYDTYEKNNAAPYMLKALIRGYLTGKNKKQENLKLGWSSDYIKDSWSNLSLLLWADDNPNIPPNQSLKLFRKIRVRGFEINEFTSQITNKRIQTFTELVLHFKHLFHIRNDNSFRDILENINKAEKWDESVEFVITDDCFPRTIEHFTDVDKLIQAYRKIIELIIDENSFVNPKNKPQIKLSLTENSEIINLSIHHLNGVYGKTLESTISRMIGNTYANLITKQINGLCNFYLRADFGYDQFAKINLWDGNNKEATMIPTFKGVEHILEFPKKKKI